jgi:hypothetical protein
MVSMQVSPHTREPVAQPHVPAEHTPCSAHGESHAPQFTRSVARSWQLESPQWVPAAHAHSPAEQTPVAQTVSHEPQCAGSLRRSTHDRSHRLRVGVHVERHVPPSQTLDSAQRFPHAPQFIGSCCTSTHASPHAMEGATHNMTHSPLRHALPVLQG